MQQTKITIGGLSGTGKGTIAVLLAEKLGFKNQSAGNFFRDLVQERGYESLLAFQKEAHNQETEDTSIDEAVDQRTREFGEQEDRFVIEGRLCAIMIPQAFNILLICDDDVRIARIAGRQHVSFEEAKEETLMREKLYSEFYQRYYDLENYADPKHYDFVIDTTHLTPSQIVEQIINKVT